MSTRIFVVNLFVSGFSTALALVGVAWLTAAAIRRNRLARSAGGNVIDGVRPPGKVERGLQPQAEANAIAEPLASEAVEVPANSQRW